jgi:response regulator RpfG family c-di-GMP phosphodiesterase
LRTPWALSVSPPESEPPEDLDFEGVEELSWSSMPPPAEEPTPLPARLSIDPPPASAGRLIGERRSFSPPANIRPPLESLENKRLEASRVPEAIGEPLQLALVLVSLLEGSRRDLRGHSLHTARLVRSVCERFDLEEPRIRAAEAGALIHDVGKASGGFHLTALNVAQFDGHRTGAEKLYATPCRVLESARLAQRTVECVTHMYERYDGTGFPNKLRANDIPLESRVLALCDSYSDLTSNPRNSYRKVLGAQEACEALREHVGTIFDPRVLDRFTRAVLGEDLARQLRRDRGGVLLVDPDIEETTVLEFALLEGQYDVYVTRSEEEALGFVEHGKGIDLIVSEVTLASGTGFSLLDRLKQSPKGQDITFVFLSSETDSSSVATALDRGAADYLLKPLASRVVVAKVRHLLEQRQRQRAVRGVSGSLEEMTLPDIVQVLHQGRKSGVVRLNSNGQAGSVYFKDGAIVHATAGPLRGQDAFYALLAVDKGDFTVDPETYSTEQTIDASPEMLLLEGLRRLDESRR